MLTSRGLGTVLGDLASMGFNARWGVLGAADVGANHQRDRIWIVARWRGNLPHAQHDRIRWWEQQQESIKKTSRELANTRCELRSARNATKLDSETQIWATSTIHNQSGCEGQNVSNADFTQQQRGSISCRIQKKNPFFGDSCWWETEPNVGRVANGLASRVDRLKAIGNGQVPLCAATAWKFLNNEW